MQHAFGIIGLGAMGTAAAWQLAARGADVVGFDQFGPGHDQGSSHGSTRIIRTVYFEGALYNPLLDRAYALWNALEADHGQAFLRVTGGLDISVRQDGVFEQALAAAEQSDKPFEVLDRADIETRFPAFDFDGAPVRAVYAPGSGLLDSDAASAWMRGEAERLGARLNFNCPVKAWQRRAGGFVLETDQGEVRVNRLILAAGAWMGQLLPQLAPVLVPERQVVAWYSLRGRGADTLPIFQYEDEMARRYYGFPPHGSDPFKLGLYHHRKERGAEHIRARGVDETDHALLRAGFDTIMPGADTIARKAVECRFTLAPDDRFVIGPMPDDHDLILLSACSGHGYKFAPAIGEMVAQMAMEERMTVDASAFSVERVV